MGTDLGPRIKALRRARCWTQSQLAEKVGVAKNSINRVENALAAPSLALLQRLADVLGAPLTVTITPRRRRSHR
ncbi:MAG: helix-turn-helix transcriptional regulator [Betaproteobacteria bacterium]|nr:helix-turn-helix transcriptional regulator [Betaproteobacteria bacterium]